MLKTRILAAVVVLAATIGALWYDVTYATSWGFAGAMMLFVLGGLREFYRFARMRGYQPLGWWGYLCGAGLVVLHEQSCLEAWHGAPALLPGQDPLLVGLGVAVLGTLLFHMILRGPTGYMMNVGATLLGLLYCWFLPSFISKLHHLTIPRPAGTLWVLDGVELVAMCILVSKVSDVGGYLVGSKLGKRKLCSQLSPKKTWEGTLGGVVFSIATLALFVVRTPEGVLATFAWPWLMLLGVLLAVSALLGDLVESSFKRDSEVKDAGTAVPGFGGVLDLVDSLMVAGPVMYGFLILHGAVPAA